MTETYEVQLTLEDGVKIEAENVDEALQKARQRYLRTRRTARVVGVHVIGPDGEKGTWS